MTRSAARHRRVGLLLLLVALGTQGCYSMTLYSGLPPSRSTPRIHHRWHHSFLLGTLQWDTPIDLTEACPRGWSVVEVKTTSLQGLVRVTSLFLYTPQEVTVACGEGSSPGPGRERRP